ncbi:unnamed protein product [marine sediment metagenome]|uniref:Uncharacterized protein n=1 Tax=marine sediment metagenome TaxID=412755 RepID=X1L2W6_9ZZZZ
MEVSVRKAPIHKSRTLIVNPPMLIFFKNIFKMFMIKPVIPSTKHRVPMVLNINLKINPKKSPNRAKIEPSAIKNSTPSKTLSK